MIIILLNIIWEKIRSDGKEENSGTFMNQKNVLWRIKCCTSGTEKKSIELDDCLLECRKEADVKLITALLG